MIHPFGVTGFILLTAMSTRNDEPEPRQPALRPRPRRLRAGRGGRHARARGARARQGPRRRIHGEVAGHGSTADAFRITDSHDEGRGAIAAMHGALADAGLDPDDVDYINAHGTSTRPTTRSRPWPSSASSAAGVPDPRSRAPRA